MADKGEKFLSMDEFKERVYKNIGTLEALDENFVSEKLKLEKSGCSGFFMIPLLGVLSKANKSARRELKIAELNGRADALLAQADIRDLLCAKLDATVVLPIDVAYKLTPVLYGLALEDENKVPFDSMLFAIISRKIVKEGVENFCSQSTTKTENENGEETTGKKPSGE
jgi:hypothetical protein